MLLLTGVVDADPSPPAIFTDGWAVHALRNATHPCVTVVGVGPQPQDCRLVAFPNDVTVAGPSPALGGPAGSIEWSVCAPDAIGHRTATVWCDGLVNTALDVAVPGVAPREDGTTDLVLQRFHAPKCEEFALKTTRAISDHPVHVLVPGGSAIHMARGVASAQLTGGHAAAATGAWVVPGRNGSWQPRWVELPALQDCIPEPRYPIRWDASVLWGIPVLWSLVLVGYYWSLAIGLWISNGVASACVHAMLLGAHMLLQKAIPFSSFVIATVTAQVVTPMLLGTAQAASKVSPRWKDMAAFCCVHMGFIAAAFWMDQ